MALSVPETVTTILSLQMKTFHCKLEFLASDGNSFVNTQRRKQFIQALFGFRPVKHVMLGQKEDGWALRIYGPWLLIVATACGYQEVERPFFQSFGCD
jgi:hypothetical protein